MKPAMGVCPEDGKLSALLREMDMQEGLVGIAWLGRLLLLLPNVMEHRSLLVVYVFNFYQTLRVVPHGTKGTGPWIHHKTSVFEVPVQEQHEHSFYSRSTNTFITGSLQVLCTWYTGFAHHRALQTSGWGWADSKAVHGMECSGARSHYWRSLSAGAAA